MIAGSAMSASCGEFVERQRLSRGCAALLAGCRWRSGLRVGRTVWHLCQTASIAYPCQRRSDTWCSGACSGWVLGAGACGDRDRRDRWPLRRPGPFYRGQGKDARDTSCRMVVLTQVAGARHSPGRLGESTCVALEAWRSRHQPGAGTTSIAGVESSRAHIKPALNPRVQGFPALSITRGAPSISRLGTAHS